MVRESDRGLSNERGLVSFRDDLRKWRSKRAEDSTPKGSEWRRWAADRAKFKGAGTWRVC